MTKNQLQELADKLAEFSSEYHSYNPPPEIAVTIEMILEEIEANASE